MADSYNDFAPYFRNGRLYLPQKTVTLLTDAGLRTQIANNALNGLDLVDNRDQIALINQALETLLGGIEENTQEFRALNSEESRFLLTGKPAAAV